MKIKNIKVGVKSVKQGLKEFSKAIRNIKEGRKTKGSKKGVYFISVEAMRRILTPRRLELLHMIREKHPNSLYELSHMSGRDQKNIQDDVAMLARIGLINLSKPKVERERVIPSVEYDHLQIQIPVV